jgi:hypothetical protein
MADPMDEIIARAKAASNEQIAFYTEHLKANVSAWRNHIAHYDRDALIQNCVKTLMESDNTREDLCYKVTVAIDMMARKI